MTSDSINEKISRVYEFHPFGGHCSEVVHEGNVGLATIHRSLDGLGVYGEAGHGSQLEAERDCLVSLAAMDKDARWKALAFYHGWETEGLGV